jgi:hypothetical protein
MPSKITAKLVKVERYEDYEVQINYYGCVQWATGVRCNEVEWSHIRGVME